MAKFIATYDLKSDTSPYQEFVTQARKKPWNCWILSSEDVWYRLPNTTLVGTFSDRAAAVASLEAVRSATEQIIGRKVVMEKYIVAEYDGASFDGDVHQPKN